MSALETAVVTGATGFIGSALIRRLSAEGSRVICLVRPESTRADRLAGIAGVEVIRPPSFEPDVLATAVGELRSAAVFHLAAYGVDPSERDPNLMLAGNAALTANVLLAAKAWQPRRFVFAGSCSEYAPAPQGQRITETHPLEPTTLYGAAKAAAHVYAGTLAAHLEIPFVGLRVFGTFGVGEAPYRLIQHLIARYTSGDEPELTLGEQERDLIYVDNVVEAIVLAATRDGLNVGARYNVCSGTPRRIADVARRVAALTGHPDGPFGLGRRPYRGDEPMWIVGDATRFRTATGWAPKVSLDQGIQNMIEARG